MNNVSLIGRLTKDVELKYTQSGIATATFNLAVGRKFKNANGEYETDFIQCQIWKNGAENLAKYAGKGSQIGVSGEIRTRNYDNQQGQRVYVTEVLVNSFDLLEKRSDNGSQMQNQYNQPPQQQNAYTGGYGAYNAQGNQGAFIPDGHPVDISEDDLPF
ncbi:single-stranded DNA-binding protein [Aerococcaceae bacterium NML160702]|nr:single-stranded DNA-binding protein [Aerococcaceae bacterium NML160702]